MNPSELRAYHIMKKYQVNFSKGVSLPSSEVLANASDLGYSVLHNRNIHNAHHDIILPALTRIGIVNIAVQAKASFDLSDLKTMTKQLLVSPASSEQVKQLIWLYLGEKRREENFNTVVFLDGSGCCNGLALDLFILVMIFKKKKKKSD